MFTTLLFIILGYLAGSISTAIIVCRAMGLPVAWNLAGGYQRDATGGIRPVLDIHDNTLIEAGRVWL